MRHYKTKVKDRILAFLMAVLLIVNIVPVASYSQVKASSESGEEAGGGTQDSDKQSLPEGYYIQVVDKENASNPMSIEGVDFKYNITATPISTPTEPSEEEKTYSFTGKNISGGYIELEALSDSEWTDKIAAGNIAIEYCISLAGENMPDYKSSTGEISVTAKADGENNKSLGEVVLERNKPTSYVKITLQDGEKPVGRATISYEIVEQTATVDLNVQEAAKSVVTYDDGTAYIGIANEDSGKVISYNISKNGYKGKTGTIAIPSTVNEGQQTITDGSTTIEDFSKPKITVNCTGGSAKYKINNGSETEITQDSNTFETEAGNTLQFIFTPNVETPQKGTKYVKNFSIQQTDGINTEEHNQDLTENLYTRTIENIQRDTTITIDFGTKYVVTVPQLNGDEGSIVVSNQEINDTNTGFNKAEIDSESTDKTVYIKMKANSSFSQESSTLQSYQINSINIKPPNATEAIALVKEGIKQENVTGITITDPLLNEDKTEYTAKIIVDDNIDITEASFIKVYQVKVDIDKDSESGSGSVDIDSEAGVISKIIRSNESFTINAKPKTGYKVTKVTKNDADLTEAEMNGCINNGNFSATVEKIDQNYTYIITFTKKVYNITIIESPASDYGMVNVVKKGSVDTFSITQFCHGDILSVTITPKGPFRVRNCSVKKGVVADEIFINPKLQENGDTYFDIEEKDSGVTDNITITVEYERIPVLDSYKQLLTDYLDITALKGVNGGYVVIENGVVVIKDSDSRYGDYYVYCNKDAEKIQMRPKEANDIAYNKIKDLLMSKSEWKEFIEYDVDTIDSRIIRPKIIEFDTPESEMELGEFYFISDTTPPTRAEGEDSILFLEREGDGDFKDCYNKDVNLSVKAVDDNGIKKVSYKVTKPKQDGSFEILKQGDIYNNDKVVKKEFGLETDNPQKIPIDVDDDIVVSVTVEDLSGNVYEESKQIYINKTAPNIKITSNDQQDDKKENAEDGYYQKKSLKISIKDRETSYNLDSVKLTANYRESKDVKDPVKKEIILKDKNVTWEAVDADGYRTAEVELEEDGIYSDVNVEYTNKNGSDGTVEKNAPEDTYTRNFVIDKTEPETAQITVGNTAWDNLLSVLTFGIWQKNTEISITGSDNLSDVKIFYFIDDEISDKTKPYTSTDLDGEKFVKKFADNEYKKPISIENDNQFVVYAKIIDFAGNYKYVCSDGLIVDTQAVEKDNIVFEVDGNEASGKHEGNNSDGTIYTSDVNIGLKITDTEKSSGIQNISYRIVKDGTVKTDSAGNETVELGTNGTVTQDTTTLYDFDMKDPVIVTDENALKSEEISKNMTYEQLQASRQYQTTEPIVVKAADNNSCNVFVEVTVQDKVGNITSKVLPLDIDYECENNKPIIQLSYDTDDVKGDKYFNTARTATISVTDRIGHLNEESLKLNDDNTTDGIKITANEQTNIPIMIDWDKKMNTDNQTETHTATIAFKGNDTYKMSIHYSSKAGHIVKGNMDNTGENDNIVMISPDTKLPYEFTISTTEPTGTMKVLEDSWNKILETLTFHLYKNDKFAVSIENATAGNSPIKSIEYYKFTPTESKMFLTKEDLMNITTWETYENPIEITSDGHYIVYAKLTSEAENIGYISTDGLIVDTQAAPDKTNDEGVIEKEGITFTVHGQKSTVQHIINENVKSDIYTDNVQIDLDVTDLNVTDEVIGINGNLENSSGLQTISYRIVKDATLQTDGNNEKVIGGTVTQDTTILYDFNKKDPMNPNSEKKTDDELKNTTYKQLNDSRRYTKENAIEVNAKHNNSCNVFVEVTVQDKAGNIRTKVLPLDIDYICDENKPSIKLSFDDKDNNNTAKNDKYFAKTRTATVTITERAGHFDETAATEGIKIAAVDAKGEAIGDDKIPSINWVEGTDKTIHTATIAFENDANYKWDIKYKNKENVENPIAIDSDVDAPYEFTVDKTVPTSILTAIIDNNNDNKAGTWDNNFAKEEAKDLAVSIRSNKVITVMGTSSDVTSPIDSVSFYKTNSKDSSQSFKAMTKKDLEDLEQNLWAPILSNIDGKSKVDYTAYSTKNDDEENHDEEFAIYIKVVDKAGNIGYYHTDGMIFDETLPNVEHIAPQVTVSPQQPINGIYNGDVPVDIRVTDPKINGVYSGIQTVTYQVYNMDSLTKDEEKILDDTNETEYKDSFEKTITVDSKANNSNNVVVKVRAVDFAGNVTEVSSQPFKIDITKPTIEVKYDDDKPSTPVNEKYYSSRTATITITERNFDADKVDVKITKTNANGIKDTNVPTVSAWTKTVGSGNEDDTKYTATIIFSEDGVYKIDSISYTDMAGNANENVKWDGQTPQEFVIDNTKPKGTVRTTGKQLAYDVENGGSIISTVEKFWSKLCEILTFGLYHEEEFKILVEAVDETSPCTIYYYVVKGDEAAVLLDEAALNKLNEGTFVECENQKADKGTSTGTITITDNDQYVVYMKLVDYAGNYSYLSTNSLILDNAPISTEDIKLSLADTNKATGTHEKTGRTDTAIYNGDVTVNVNVDDGNHSVGIQKIEYRVIKDDDTANPTQTGVLYDFNKVNPTNPMDANNRDKTKEELENVSYEQLNASRKYENNNPIEVKADLNNSCNVYAEVIVTDKLGRVTSNKIYMDIDRTYPTISLSYDNNTAKHEKYFERARTATITITEREGHFDAQAATQGITIRAKDINDKNVDVGIPTVSEWTPVQSMEPDKSVHNATITFAEDANYDWEITYKNKADLSNESINEGDLQAPFEFAVDKTAPTGQIWAEKNQSNTWKKLIEELTFGVYQYYDETLEVSINQEDKTSPCEPIYYYILTGDEAATLLSKEELDELYQDDLNNLNKDVKNFKEYDSQSPISVNESEQYVVYARLMDYAGNYDYISTNGLILDNASISTEDIKLSLADTNKAAGTHEKTGRTDTAIYNGDVTVNVMVDDGNHSVGIEKIEYQVIKDDDTANPTQTGVLYDFNKLNPTSPMDVNNRDKTKEELENVSYEQLNASRKYENNNPIEVKANLNNSCNVYVEVTVIDKLDRKTSKKIYMDIDITHPTISLSYDNDTAKHEKYFDRARTATVVITERAGHFDEEAATKGITITAKDINGNDIEAGKIPTVNGWTPSENNSMPDLATHTATITFANDANYEMTIEYTNKAEHKVSSKEGDNLVETSSVAPYEFTVDKVAPTGKINTADNTWDKLLTVLTFGLYHNEKFEVVINNIVEETSPHEIDYYISTDEEASKLLNKEALDERYENNQFRKYDSTITIANSQQYIVYAKLTDYAGNYMYISTDGLIVDTSAISEEDIKLSLADTNIATGTHEKAGRTDTAIYNGDVTVHVEVEDKNKSVGIKNINYKIIKDDNTANPTQTGVLYDFNKINPTSPMDANNRDKTEDELKKTSYEQLNASRGYKDNNPIVVKADLNNSCNVYAEVTVTDKLNRETSKKIYMDIDIVDPTIALSYDNDTAKNDKYFDNARTATVVITERTGHFDAQAATQGITTTAVNAKQEKVSLPQISEWTTREGSTPDSATHTATIAFHNDANYTLEIAYTDKADRKNQPVNSGNSQAPYEFTVDTTVPNVDLTASIDENVAGGWSNQFITDLTFGIRTNRTITVEGTSDDETSPVESVSIYKSNLSEAMTKDELKNITSWRSVDNNAAYEAYTANSDEQFTIYVRVSDMAGNTEYYSTNGMIFDKNAPDVEHVAPVITISQPINDIYNDDVPVDIRVTDPIINNSYSGLKEISYKVFNMDSETHNDILYKQNVEEPDKNNINQSWSDTITVSKENNSNDVVVEVYALDYAGNETTVRSNSFKIDTTAPEISISYDNNVPVNEKYYKENRTAVITITERNFDANDVKIDITNTDGVIPSVSGWTQSGGSGNNDDTINTATITYEADGDYTFAIAYTDMAGNACLGETYGDSATPKEFTIDKTLPVISMEIDGNSRTGSEYFDAARTATITVNEHNFNEADFQLHLTTKDNGTELGTPALSGFSSNGDVHTATITFDRDEEVVISGDFTDMAGNIAETLQEARFVVDLTDPVIELDGNSLILDKTYGKNETVTPRIHVTDTNFDPSKVTLEVIGRKYGNVDVNVQTGDIANGMSYVLSGIETDDVYEMKVSVADRSGREKQYTANFHVNRNGSTYAFGSALQTINKTYVQKLTEDLTIIETNVDPLESYILTLSQGGIIKELELNTDFTVSANVNNDGWMEYVYTIKNKVFSGNSTYLITVSSVDNAGNSSDSTAKDSNMTFVVDDEAPTLIVTGVENNMVYMQDKLDITVETYDNIEIMELRVVLNGELRVYTAEELKDNNGKIIISIPSSDKNQSLEITAVDYAGNESQIANYTDIIVSTNTFIRIREKYLKNIWFYIIVGSVIIVVGTAIWFVITKRKTKENE